MTTAYFLDDLPFKFRSLDVLAPGWRAYGDQSSLGFMLGEALDRLAADRDFCITEVILSASAQGSHVADHVRAAMVGKRLDAKRYYVSARLRHLERYAVTLQAIEHTAPVSARNAFGKGQGLGYQRTVAPITYRSWVEKRRQQGEGANFGPDQDTPETIQREKITISLGTARAELPVDEALAALNESGSWVHRCPVAQRQLRWKFREVHASIWPADGADPELGPRGPIFGDDGLAVELPPGLIGLDGQPFAAQPAALTTKSKGR